MVNVYEETLKRVTFLDYDFRNDNLHFWENTIAKCYKMLSCVTCLNQLECRSINNNYFKWRKINQDVRRL